MAELEEVAHLGAASIALRNVANLNIGGNPALAKAGVAGRGPWRHPAAASSRIARRQRARGAGGG